MPSISEKPTLAYADALAVLAAGPPPPPMVHLALRYWCSFDSEDEAMLFKLSSPLPIKIIDNTDGHMTPAILRCETAQKEYKKAHKKFVADGLDRNGELADAYGEMYEARLDLESLLP
ncbi:MAG: hypothetical protein ACJ8EB_01900 [Allosphingosinicella sp.]